MYTLVIRDIVISCARITVTRMLITLNTVISYKCITITWVLLVHILIYHCCVDSPVCMLWLSLSSCCPSHCSCYMIYCYMNIHVFLWH